MLNNVKLDGKTFYAKIRIWPYLDCIILFLFKMISYQNTNKFNGEFLSLLLKSLEFFLACTCLQQYCMKIVADNNFK